MTWEWVVLILGLFAEFIALCYLANLFSDNSEKPQPKKPSAARPMTPYDADEDPIN